MATTTASILALPTLLCQLMNVCYRPPELDLNESMQSHSALRGQDTQFTCRVRHVGRHLVAFVRLDDDDRRQAGPRLLALDDRVFIAGDKYEVRARDGAHQDEWVLTVKNVQLSDAANYSCQVNAEPVQRADARLEVRTPPWISRETPAAVEVREGADVSLLCDARGRPSPSVVWRRQDRQIIRYHGSTGFGASLVHGAELKIRAVSRAHMADYICTASNGVPPDQNWTLKLLVTFPPTVLAQQSRVGAARMSHVRLVCQVEAWPKANVKWTRKSGSVRAPVVEDDRIKMASEPSGPWKSVHALEFRSVETTDYGVYVCEATNEIGRGQASINLHGLGEHALAHASAQGDDGFRSESGGAGRFDPLLSIRPIDGDGDGDDEDNNSSGAPSQAQFPDDEDYFPGEDSADDGEQDAPPPHLIKTTPSFVPTAVLILPDEEKQEKIRIFAAASTSNSIDGKSIGVKPLPLLLLLIAVLVVR